MAKVFNKYEVIHKIGSGGMSSVYLGKHIVLGKSVAIKTLNPGLALDKQYIERFEHEAKATAALYNNNIISVIDYGNVENDYFIVMDYVEGRDLRHLQRTLHDKVGAKIGFPIDVALAILLEVAFGLKKAHEKGVIHRDIKPSNVLLSIDGEVKIVDFGLALSLGTLKRLAKSRFTRTGTVIGTPSSMSPEQAAGRTDIDHRSDIFSLGVLAYHLLTGRKPFRGRTDSELLEKIREGKLEPLTADSCPLLTDTLLVLIQRMLEKSRTNRPQSMDEVIQKTTECLVEFDPQGELTHYRRKHLARFAADPAAFVDSRREINISRHLQRGESFRNHEGAHIGDAIREYRFVIALDPEHPEALAAIRDLESQVDDQEMTLPEMDKPAHAEEPTQPLEEAPESETVDYQADGDQQQLAAKTEEGEDPDEDQDTGPDNVPHGRSWMWWLISIPVLLGLWLLLKDQIFPPPPPVQPQPTPKASILVNSVPSGARIWLRGPGYPGFHDTGWVTNCLISDLVAGNWEARIALEDYIADTLQIELIASVSETLDVNLDPLVRRGLLSVSTEPEGATLVLRNVQDNVEQYRGPAPIENMLLQEGTYRVRAVLADHYPWTGSVVVRMDAPIHKDIPLQAIPPDPPPVKPDTVVVPPPPPQDGYIRINSDFEVIVKIDNSERWRGTGFTVLALPPGREYDLHLHRPETFSNYSQAVTVNEGETTVIDDRVFKYGTLLVGTDAPCGLEIDGVSLGREETYYEFPIGTGRHSIGITCSGNRVIAVEEVNDDGTANRLNSTASGTYQINIREGAKFWINVELHPND